MSIDAVLIGLSLVSFLALLVTWLSAPLSADAPAPHVVLDSVPSSAVAA